MNKKPLLLVLLLGVLGVIAFLLLSKGPGNRSSHQNPDVTETVIPEDTGEASGRDLGEAKTMVDLQRPSIARPLNKTSSNFPEATEMIEVPDLPRDAGEMARIGPFEEVEARRYLHPDGSYRSLRLLRTEMKYPLLRVEEVFSGESRTLARQEIAVADHVMVQFVEGTTPEEIETTVERFGLEIRRTFSHPGLVLLAIPEASISSLPETVRALKGEPLIESSEPDYLVFSN